MWRTPHAFSTSICCCGSGLISSAKALRVNILLARGWIRHGGKARSGRIACVYLVHRRESVLLDNRQLGLIREKRSLACSAEPNLDFALRSRTDHERDAARAVLIVANEHPFLKTHGVSRGCLVLSSR